jgi:hypothetical protein
VEPEPESAAAQRDRPVELEGVGTIAVSGLLLKVLGKVDDHDGIEWAFLRTQKNPS